MFQIENAAEQVVKEFVSYEEAVGFAQDAEEQGTFYRIVES